MKKETCKLYILRHGETEWNREERVQGHSDSTLSEVGIEQAQNASHVLKEISFSAVYSSDLGRAFKTAHIVKGERNLMIYPRKELRERFFPNHFEGLVTDEFRALTKQSREVRSGLSEKERWIFSLNGIIESDHNLVSRFMDELHRIAQKHKGETVLVVSHGGCIRTFLMKLGVVPYGSLPAGTFKNCGYVVANSDGAEFKIEKIEGLGQRDNKKH